MERSLSALTYNGSVTEAILEAKRQKKLFVVYISGEDALSVNLASSTLTEAKVAESLSKYCIFLHIPSGSPDAANFSAIYPQKSVPCITAVGYNGVQVWQSDVSSTGLLAEDLASSLEKAWLSLHIQETTATFLTAALASKKSEPSSSGASVLASSEQGNSPSTVVQSASTNKDVQSSNGRNSVASEMMEENNNQELAAENKVEELGEKISSRSSNAKSASVGNKHSNSSPQPWVEDSSGADHLSSRDDDGQPAEEKNVDHHPEVPKGGSQLILNDTNKVESEQVVAVERRAVASDCCPQVNKSSDVHLNIRLPNGVSLQERFSVESTLRMVKDYVDENQESGIGSYDLAIPYPRRLFTDQELGKSLSELGLFNRQALIVVPRQTTASSNRGGSLPSQQTNSMPSSNTSDGNAGYVAYIRKFLSYFNPFSYLGNGASSSTSGPESQSGIWEYSPNPALRNNLAGRPYSTSSPDQHTSGTGTNDSRSRKPTTSSFGSNIHTLKHDEDDNRFGDKNPFWNGNSTQYGGSSDSK